VLSIHAGNFEDLAPPNQSPPLIVSSLEGELESLLRLLGQQQQQPQQLPYRWLPAAALGALVQLLAAVILKPGGKVKQALLHISRGEVMMCRRGAKCTPSWWHAWLYMFHALPGQPELQMVAETELRTCCSRSHCQELPVNLAPLA
jgi:hypothetical protein